MTPEKLAKIREALLTPAKGKEALWGLFKDLLNDYESLLTTGKTQSERNSCPSLEKKPNPLELEISITFNRMKQGYSSPCTRFELHKFGKKWTLKDTLKGTDESFLGKKDATNKVRLFYCSSIMDQMWDQGYEVKKEGLNREEARLALSQRAKFLVTEKNLRVQEGSLDRVALYLANLFC